MKFGKGSNFAVLKMQPIFFTYFPGFGVDAAQVANLDRFYDGKTHHLHGSPVFWNSPTLGPMLFVWGENECLRAWRVDPAGTVSFFAKSAEVASAGLGGTGGMPGGMPTLSANGNNSASGSVKRVSAMACSTTASMPSSSNRLVEARAVRWSMTARTESVISRSATF